MVSDMYKSVPEYAKWLNYTGRNLTFALHLKEDDYLKANDAAKAVIINS